MTVKLSRGCARPGCGSAAAATLQFRYQLREVALGPLADSASPESYDLCSAHADRTSPPYGWSLEDGRSGSATPAMALTQDW